MTTSTYWARVNLIENMIRVSALTLNNNEEKPIDGLTNIFKASTDKFLDYPTNVSVKIAKFANNINVIINVEGDEETWSMSEFAETIASASRVTEFSA